MKRLVEIAVPLPLPEALTYAVPEAFGVWARPGARARVQVGRRKLVGVIVAERARPPEDLKIRDLEAVIDRQPVLPSDLLQLAREAARYYMAPIGEMVRAMLPANLPAWGDHTVWVSNRGALAPTRSTQEAAVLDALRDGGRRRISDLVRDLGDPELDKTVDRLEREGRIMVSRAQRGRTRYLTAVELASGSVEELRERCGRSAPGRQIVDLLAALDRPATVEELCGTVGCTAAVVRRLISLGILRRFLQVARLTLDHHVLEASEESPLQLRKDQCEAVAQLHQALDAGGYGAFLLAGMTGSGKTEVYLQAVERALEQGGSAIVLVPEIALVPALAGSARRRFGSKTAIFHSAMSGSERQQEWERIRQGQARLALGPRSAVFAPLESLRLVVIDEEQDASYKQDQIPRYNGRDLGVLRAHGCEAVAVLVSATPSLESRHNVEVGKMARLVLRQRVGQGKLPEGVLVDLRKEAASRQRGEVHISERLRDEIGRCLGQGDQVILLRNRRGYAPMLLCRACGQDARCTACGLPRTYHRRERRLRCHYCGSSTAVPEACPACSAEALEAIGSGTERVEETVQKLWPQSVVEVLDRDTARRGQAAAVLERFSRGQTQILVGTQMVSKGHHFPNVSLTAVLLADTYLGFPDFRAVEKTYGLLTQLAGRAGRGQRRGQVIIQTYHPDHYAIQAALLHDDRRFAAEEMRFRRIFHYPPYTRMIQLLYRDRNRSRAEEAMERLAHRLEAHPKAAGVRISGPAPAPFEKLRGKWRYQLLLRHRSGQRLRELLDANLPRSGPSEMIIDVDPYELL